MPLERIEQLRGEGSLIVELLSLRREVVEVRLQTGSERCRIGEQRQQLADGGDAAARVSEHPHARRFVQLRGRVSAVAGEGIALGGHEDAPLGVVAQHADAQPRIPREITDIQQPVGGLVHALSLTRRLSSRAAPPSAGSG